VKVKKANLYKFEPVLSYDRSIMKRNIKNLFSGRTAVFIDAANLERSLADLGTKPPNLKRIPKGFVWKPFPKGYWSVDYKKLRKFFAETSRLVSISFYSAKFGTKSHENFLAFLKFNGYRLVTKKIKEIKTGNGDHRKANFDVEIAVDAVSWIRNFDTFVLFSGDSDFTHLLHHLSKKKKRTVVISQRGHVANELVKAADYYLDIFGLRGEILRPKTQKSR